MQLVIHNIVNVLVTILNKKHKLMMRNKSIIIMRLPLTIFLSFNRY